MHVDEAIVDRFMGMLEADRPSLFCFMRCALSQLPAQNPAGFGSWVGGFAKKGTANRNKPRHGSSSKPDTGASPASGAQPNGHGTVKPPPDTSSPDKPTLPLNDTKSPNDTNITVTNGTDRTGTTPGAMKPNTDQIPTMPIAKTQKNSSSSSSSSQDADGNNGTNAAPSPPPTPREYPAVVIPGEAQAPPRTDINTVTNIPFGADVPVFASYEPSRAATPSLSRRMRRRISKQKSAAAAAAADGPAMATAAFAAISADSTSTQEASCKSYKTVLECETLSAGWEKMGGSAELVPVTASFVDNFFALKGKDLACLPPGTQLNFCGANSTAAAFADIKGMGS
jgi:hypothetical protein